MLTCSMLVRNRCYSPKLFLLEPAGLKSSRFFLIHSCCRMQPRKQCHPVMEDGTDELTMQVYPTEVGQATTIRICSVQGKLIAKSARSMSKMLQVEQAQADNNQNIRMPGHTSAKGDWGRQAAASQRLATIHSLSLPHSTTWQKPQGINVCHLLCLRTGTCLFSYVKSATSQSNETFRFMSLSLNNTTNTIPHILLKKQYVLLQSRHEGGATAGVQAHWHTPAWIFCLPKSIWKSRHKKNGS